MDLQLTDKLALVSGSTAGIGFAIANGLKPDRFGWLTPVKVNATEPVTA